jgi:Rrf2 family protein
MSNILALSEAASIALHSMVLIANTSEVLNIGEISARIFSSRHHVAKILQRLAKEGFISSNRGPSGGFTLRKDPDKISLLAIYETIEGPMDLQACPGAKENCPFDSCILGDMPKRISNDIREYLNDKKLSYYINH